MGEHGGNGVDLIVSHISLRTIFRSIIETEEGEGGAVKGIVTVCDPQPDELWFAYCSDSV